MLLSSAVQQFLVAAGADGLKPSTVRWYESRLRPVAAHFGLDDLADLGAPDLRTYIVALRARDQRYLVGQRPVMTGGLSPDTIHGHLRALRRFFRWAVEEYGLPTNPMLRIRLPRVAHDTPKAASLDDLAKLLAAIDDSPTGWRNRAMLMFLADTGCRAAGMLTLHRENLDLSAGRALVVEKGDKARRVYFGENTAYAVARWLDVRPGGGWAVFCSLHGPRRGLPLTLGGLHDVIRRLKMQAGVSGRVNPHSLRHMFAREYLTNGGDLSSLARIMGHSDAAVTANYYAVFDDAELKEKHGLYSPARRLSNAD